MSSYKRDIGVVFIAELSAHAAEFHANCNRCQCYFNVAS
jgi:hypothetical protein